MQEVGALRAEVELKEAALRDANAHLAEERNTIDDLEAQLLTQVWYMEDTAALLICLALRGTGPT